MELLSILLFTVGMALVVAEVVMPGIVLGLLGAAAALGGIWIGFEASPALGIGELVVAVVAVPLLFYWGMRRMQLVKAIESEPPKEDLSKLVGRTGEVVHDLKPGGTVLIDAVRYDAVALSGYLERGARVSVVKADEKKVFVRAL
jgi:membrane-bound serine protease (ClpP class)